MGGSRRPLLLWKIDFVFQRCTLLAIIQNLVTINFFLDDDICIALRGTAGGFAVSNPLGGFFFVIIDFASRCVSAYDVLLEDFLEVPRNDVFG